MLPLGESWSGFCRALPDEVHPVSDACCNLGYARGNCVRFPLGEGPDAVRFTISRHESAGLRIYYVIERDHQPFAHGALEYSFAAACFTSPVEPETVARQAQAYVQSYLRRSKEPCSKEPCSKEPCSKEQ
jgi:hypothetical protein